MQQTLQNRAQVECEGSIRKEGDMHKRRVVVSENDRRLKFKEKMELFLRSRIRNGGNAAPIEPRKNFKKKAAAASATAAKIRL
ncbi:hypothetical protein [Hyphomicrobium sp.]|uniref:hypothetical protein n=1 Tax=Hyphomicrobium sp. TaxID=82 RepID=UPI003F72B0FA